MGLDRVADGVWLLRGDLKQNPQVIVAAVAIAAELGFSLKQCFR